MSVANRNDLSLETLQALLKESEEHETVDYKEVCDLDDHDEKLELVKDIGAMQFLGGYLVIGATNSGGPSGRVTERHKQLFDSATLRDKVVPYLGESISVRSRVHHLDGNDYVLIRVEENPKGVTPFVKTGKKADGKSVVFHQGAVYARHGSKSEPWNSNDVDRLQKKLAAGAKEEDVALTWELEDDAFIDTARNLIAGGKLAPIKMLLTGVANDVSPFLGDVEGAEQVKIMLDRLTCLAALALRLDEQTLFRPIVAGFVAIYQLPVDRNGSSRFEQAMPRVHLWLEVMQRVIAIGGLAERLEAWHAIRELVPQKGKGSEFDYHPNWYRHALARAAQANLIRTQENKHAPTFLDFAQQQVSRLACLRFDLPPGDDELLNSICRFDFLAGVVAMAHAGDGSERTYYPSFAKYHEHRTRPAAEALLDDPEMRQTLFPLNDESLATALYAINNLADYDSSLRGWLAYFGSEKVQKFVEENFRQQP